MKNRLMVLVSVVLGCTLFGCSSGDPGAATTEKPRTQEQMAQVQKGASASKMANGGGMADDGVVPAKPGEKTGLPQTGMKSKG
ncbi:MAG: hypothetical protein WCG75_11260 [Armatimonadota bacterium]